MLKLDRDYLTIKCVYLYYKEKLTIKEISNKLEISRFKVSRYIRQAEEKGYVKVNFNFPGENYIDLATRIEQKYSVKNVIIVPVIPDMNIEMIREAVGQRGAEILKNMDEDTSIGITWGRTIAKVVENLPSHHIRLKRIAELTGGYGMFDTMVSFSSLAPMLARKTKSSCFQIHAPIIASNKAVAKSILKEESIKRTMEMAANSDIAIFGAASISKDSMFYNSKILSEQELIRLKKSGVAGAILGRFYNSNGEEADTIYKERVVSISWEDFLNIPERIAFIAGENKLESLKGLLRGKLATTIIIDSNLAHKLIETESY